MAGRNVTRQDLDMQTANNIVALRDALDKSRSINDWLALHPSNALEGDVLTMPQEEGGFGYTSDEAYNFRVLYEGIAGLDVTQLEEWGKHLTGLD